MGRFNWISSGELPEQIDLRRKGWKLSSGIPPDEKSVTIIDASNLEDKQWLKLLTSTSVEERRTMLIYGVETSDARAKLLASGFGDALGSDSSSDEFEARVVRLKELSNCVPQRRVLMSLEMDLLHREVRYSGKLINLHPREFALLWRLADTPDESVTRATLVRDVWRLGFMPESNSVAVHISRLRSKLATEGLGDLVETTSKGYRLQQAILEFAGTSTWLHNQAKTKPQVGGRPRKSRGPVHITGAMMAI